MSDKKKAPLISIVGDSISTYAGYNPRGFAVFYDEAAIERNGLSSADDTWWGLLIRALGGKLCVNNSFSGSMVSAGYYGCACDPERTEILYSRDGKPDIILIYMGANDYGHGVKLISERAPHDDLYCFYDAYKRMIRNIKDSYPKALIVCGTVLKGRTAEDGDIKIFNSLHGIAIEDYNRIIKRVCREEGIVLADLAAADERYMTLDGGHPTKEGHKDMFVTWLKALRDNPDFPYEIKY